MRLLVVEDDKKIASFIVKGLKQAGFATDHAEDGETALHRVTSEPYGAAIVDIMIPKLDGLALVETMRKRKIKTPVIILSAKRSVDDRIKGLAAGGDDYLAKPFSFSELLARVHALLRRSSEFTEAPQRQVGDLRIDILAREVRRGDVKIELHPHEFSLLDLLMLHAGRPVSKAMILDNVWEYDFDPQTNVVDVLVCRLRDKVDKPFGKPMIQTMRGVGYVLKAS